MTQHGLKPHTHQRPTMGQRGRADDNYEYALGNGGPSGSELPPVLNGVRCVNCGEPLGKEYRVSIASPICGDSKACAKRCAELDDQVPEEAQC